MQKNDNDILQQSINIADSNIYYSDFLNEIINNDFKDNSQNNFIKYKNNKIMINKIISLKFKKNKTNIVLCINNKVNSGSILDIPELISFNILNKNYELKNIKLNKIENKSLNNDDIYIMYYTCKNIKEMQNE